MFFLLFTNFLYLCHNQYTTECFITSGFGNKITLRWVNELSFIPDTLKIKITIKEVTKNNNENNYESTIFITRLKNIVCDHNFLPVPTFISDETLFVHIKVDLLFMNYIIDHFENFLRQGFKTITVYNEGFNNKLWVYLFFLENEKKFEKYISNDIVWMINAKYINSHNTLCMRFMNVEGVYIFQTDYISSTYEQLTINQYHLLRIFSYEDEEMNQLVSTVEYITQIYECGGTVTHFPIKMFVDQSIKAIEIHLIPEGKSESLYKMKLVRQEKIFFSVSSPEYYDKLFDIKVEDELVKIAWEQRKKSLLLYEQMIVTQLCIVDDMEIENDVMIYSGRSFIVNWRAKGMRIVNYVFIYGYVTDEQMERCHGFFN